MKLSDFIKTLQQIQDGHPNSEVTVELVQDLEVPVPANFTAKGVGKYICWMDFFIGEEEVDDIWVVSLRTWPY